MLKKAMQHVVETNVNEFDIGLFRDNITDYNNLQKLRYHGLIARVIKNGIVQRGKWLVTHQAGLFLRGEIKLPKWVEIADNHIVARSQEQVGVKDIYYGSEIVLTTFEYRSGDREYIAPLTKPNLQISLI